MKQTHKIFPDGRTYVRSEAETNELGHRLADVLEPGDVLGFVGSPGAGKTRLIRGILEGLGSPTPAVSPTFNLVLEHPSARIPAAHFDFYRLRNVQEAQNIGWVDYTAPDCDMVLLVEWADQFDGALMPERTAWLVLRQQPGRPTEREVWLRRSPALF